MTATALKIDPPEVRQWFDVACQRVTAPYRDRQGVLL